MTRKQVQRKNKIFGILSFVLAIITIWIFTGNAHAQLAPGENYVSACATRQPCTLTPPGGVSWVNGNQVWIVPLLQGTGSVRIWIRNLNPTSGHTSQVINVFLTDDVNASSLLVQADRWTQALVTDNSTVNGRCTQLPANNPVGAPGVQGKGTCYVSGMFGSQIAIQMTGAIAAGGSPDNFEMGIYQGIGYPGGPQPGGDSSSGGDGTTFNSQSSFAAGGGNLSLMRVPVCDIPLPANCFPAFGLAMYSGTGKAAAVDESGYANNGIGALAVVNNLSTAAPTQASASPGAQTQTSLAATTSANATGTTLGGMQIVTGPAGWSVPVQASASNCSASIAATATTRHCATGADMCIVATIAQTQLFVNLRDGATGAGTVKWNGVIADTIGLGSCILKEFTTPICGTINTAMTLELSGATGAGNGCASTLRGYDVL